MQQKFDGSFEITDSLAKILLTTSQELRSGQTNVTSRVSQIDTAMAQKVWATVYVIAMLHKWWTAYADSWRMMEDKAKQWCVFAVATGSGDKVSARKIVAELIINASI